jgi:GntR family transcriptional regulator
VDEVAVPLGTTLKHVQVREYVRGLIDELPEGAPAPSERGLMQHFGVARMTVRQAIDALVAEGLLERAPARGTFVTKTPRPVNRPLSFTEDARARGWTVSTETLQSGLGQAGPGVAKALGITPGDAVIHWRRRRRHEGAPVCYQDVYLNEVLLPGFLQTDRAVPLGVRRTALHLVEPAHGRPLRPRQASPSRPSGAIVRPDSSHTHCGDGPPMSGSM